MLAIADAGAIDVTKILTDAANDEKLGIYTVPRQLFNDAIASCFFIPQRRQTVIFHTAGLLGPYRLPIGFPKFNLSGLFVTSLLSTLYRSPILEVRGTHSMSPRGAHRLLRYEGDVPYAVCWKVYVESA